MKANLRKLYNSKAFWFIISLVCSLVIWIYVSSVKGFYPSIPTLSIRYKFFPIPLAGIVMMIFEFEQIVDDILVLAGKEATA